MVEKLQDLNLFMKWTTTLSLGDFMRKHILRDDTMNESDLERVNNYPIYPRGPKIHSDKGFVIIDIGSMGGTQWACFIVKGNKSIYSDSSGVQPDKFLLNHLPKPIIYHNYKIQDIKSKLCGSYCLYLLYLIERMNFYDTILKINFG